MPDSVTRTCCFIGHRTIHEAQELKERLYTLVERLITDEGIDTFLFGSKSRFNDLCHEIVTDIRQSYPHIKRVYVRSAYPVISDDHKAYLLERYEDTYFPPRIRLAGKAVHLERNYEMIQKSGVCVMYYDADSLPLKHST